MLLLNNGTRNDITKQWHTAMLLLSKCPISILGVLREWETINVTHVNHVTDNLYQLLMYNGL
jgi:hypothetical protein